MWTTLGRCLTEIKKKGPPDYSVCVGTVACCKSGDLCYWCGQQLQCASYVCVFVLTDGVVHDLGWNHRRLTLTVVSQHIGCNKSPPRS